MLARDARIGRWLETSKNIRVKIIRREDKKVFLKVKNSKYECEVPDNYVLHEMSYEGKINIRE